MTADAEYDAVRLLDASAEAQSPPAGHVRRCVDLPVRDDVLHIAADVAVRDIRLAEIVPFVRRADDRLMEVYLRQLPAQAKEVYCRRGCGVCCQVYLIVLSPAEMYYQMEMIESLGPDERRRVTEWLAAAGLRARQDGLIDRLRSCGPADKPLDIVDKWWQTQPPADRTCPFLNVAAGACAYYADRFIACREHYSHNPPERCAKLQTDRMATPLTLINSLWQLEGRLAGEGGGVIELPLMKLWADARRTDAARTWPAVEVVDRLFEILVETAVDAQRLRASAVVERDDGPAGV